MEKFKKISFLENRDACVAVNNAIVLDKVKGEEKLFTRKSLKEIAPLDSCYADFIEFGKRLYESNKIKIKRLDFRKIKDDKQDYLICDFIYPYIFNQPDEKCSNVISKIIDDYLSGKSNKYENTNIAFIIDNNDRNKPIERESLTDLAIFSYLVITSLMNYFNKPNNGISFSTFTNIKDDDLDLFLECIIFKIRSYTPPLYRAKLGESTEIHLNKETNEIELIRVFESIISLYWFILKLEVTAIYNGSTFINLCGCGNIIRDKSERCETCKLAHNAYNRKKQRQKAALKKEEK